MLNAKGVEMARFRKIRIRTPNGEQEVQAELIKDYDPMRKIQIYKYGKKGEMKVCLVEKITGKVIFQDATYIFPVKGSISAYRDKKGKYGMLNERGQVILEAGILKNYTFSYKRKSNT